VAESFSKAHTHNLNLHTLKPTHTLKPMHILKPMHTLKPRYNLNLDTT